MPTLLLLYLFGSASVSYHQLTLNVSSVRKHWTNSLTFLLIFFRQSVKPCGTSWSDSTRASCGAYRTLNNVVRHLRSRTRWPKLCSSMVTCCSKRRPQPLPMLNNHNSKADIIAAARRHSSRCFSHAFIVWSYFFHYCLFSCPCRSLRRHRCIHN